ncbi:MAG: hypothetical protein GX572_05920 [Clostridia bacterium]|nr:hypothetical protein [Clostridia bacterium]
MQKRTITFAAIVMTAIIMTLCAACGNTTPPQEPQTPELSGETKTYIYQDLEFEVSNIQSERTEAGIDDAGNERTYTVITYYPGARLSIIRAGMSDPAYSADGLPHPQWGVLLEPDERIKITDDMETLDITADMAGIYHLESSMYVFRFEPYAE